MRRAPLLVALALALALGCGRKEPPPPPPIAGLPAIDHAWTSAEVATAAALLDELCASAPARLPRHGDPVFARAIAADNRSTIVAAPPAARQADARKHNAAVLRIYATYERCGQPVETFAANAALLEGYATSLVSDRAILDALPADDPAAAVKRAAFDKVVAGLRGGIGSTVGMLTDAAIPPPPDDVAVRLGRAIAAVRAELPAQTLDEPLARLTAAAGAERDLARRAALTTVAAALR